MSTTHSQFKLREIRSSLPTFDHDDCKLLPFLSTKSDHAVNSKITNKIERTTSSSSEMGTSSLRSGTRQSVMDRVQLPFVQSLIQHSSSGMLRKALQEAHETIDNTNQASNSIDSRGKEFNKNSKDIHIQSNVSYRSHVGNSFSTVNLNSQERKTHQPNDNSRLSKSSYELYDRTTRQSSSDKSHSRLSAFGVSKKTLLQTSDSGEDVCLANPAQLSIQSRYTRQDEHEKPFITAGPNNIVSSPNDRITSPFKQMEQSKISLRRAQTFSSTRQPSEWGTVDSHVLQNNQSKDTTNQSKMHRLKQSLHDFSERQHHATPLANVLSRQDGMFGKIRFGHYDSSKALVGDLSQQLKRRIIHDTSDSIMNIRDLITRARILMQAISNGTEVAQQISTGTLPRMEYDGADALLSPFIVETDETIRNAGNLSEPTKFASHTSFRTKDTFKGDTILPSDRPNLRLTHSRASAEDVPGKSHSQSTDDGSPGQPHPGSIDGSAGESPRILAARQALDDTERTKPITRLSIVLETLIEAIQTHIDITGTAALDAHEHNVFSLMDMDAKHIQWLKQEHERVMHQVRASVRKQVQDMLRAQRCGVREQMQTIHAAHAAQTARLQQEYEAQMAEAKLRAETAEFRRHTLAKFTADLHKTILAISNALGIKLDLIQMPPGLLETNQEIEETVSELVESDMDISGSRTNTMLSQAVLSQSLQIQSENISETVSSTLGTEQSPVGDSINSRPISRQQTSDSVASRPISRQQSIANQVVQRVADLEHNNSQLEEYKELVKTLKEEIASLKASNRNTVESISKLPQPSLTKINLLEPTSMRPISSSTSQRGNESSSQTKRTKMSDTNKYNTLENGISRRASDTNIATVKQFDLSSEISYSPSPDDMLGLQHRSQSPDDMLKQHQQSQSPDMLEHEQRSQSPDMLALQQSFRPFSAPVNSSRPLCKITLLAVFPIWCKSHVFLNSCKDDEKLLQTTRLSAKKLRQRLQDVYKSDKTLGTAFKKSVETQPIIWKRFNQIWSANRAFFQCIPPFLTSGNILKTDKRPVVLNMSTQHWIGFDMDHTLINYDNAAVTRLIYDAALSEIIKSKGSSKSHVGSVEKMVNVAHTSLSSISNLKSGSSLSQTPLNNDDVVLPNAIQKENSGDDAKAFDSNHISIEAVAGLLQSTSDHNGTVNTTISSRQATKRFQCNVAWSQPGLVADTEGGNILSINAQEQIVRVLHGDVVQSYSKWHQKYANVVSIEAPRFQRIMTYFDAPVLSVFATLVQAADQISFKLDKSSKELSYKSLWLEAFAAVKISYSKYYPKGWPAVLATPQAYVNEPYHRNVKDWIKLFRSNPAPRRLNPLSTKSSTPKASPKLFLLTNADFSHANALMSHVYGRFWSSCFDLVVVNAKKSNMRAKASLSKSTNGADSHSIPKHHSGGKDMSVVDVITKKSRRLKDTELKFAAGDQKNEESNLVWRANKAVSIFGRKPINLDAVRKSNEGYINSTSNRPPCVLSGGCMKQLLATLYTYGSSGEDGINVTYVGDHLHTDIEPIVEFDSIKWQTIGILPTLQRFFPASSCTPTNTGTKPGRKARVMEQLKKQKMQNDNTNKMYLVEDIMNLLVASDTRNTTEAEAHINSLYSLRSNTGPWAALPADEATWLEYSAQQKAQIILPSVQFLVSCLQSPKTARRRPRSSPSSEVALSMAPSSIIFNKYHTSNSSNDHPPLYLFISGYLDAFLSQYNELGEMVRNPNGFLQRLATLFTFSSRSSATNMSTGNGSLLKLDRSTFVNSSFFSNGWINDLRDALPPASQILSEYDLNTSNYTFEHYIVKHCKFVYESAHKPPY